MQLYGGPFDGAERRRPRHGVPFVYVDERLRCWRSPRQGRVLYRVLATSLQYAEPFYVQCPGCACFHDRAATTCQLCGSNLVAGGAWRV